MKLIDPRDLLQARHLSHGDSHGAGHHYKPEELHNDDVAHEESDINIQALIWSAVVLAGVCLTTAALMAGLFKVLEAQAKSRDPKLSPLVLPATVMPPTTNTSPEFGSAPEPRLLTNEPTALRQLRTQEQETLHGYGWVNESAGVARIPIDEAKKLLLERGLPVRPEPTTDPRLGTHAPAFGESSSGRNLLKAPAESSEAPSPAPAAAAPAHEAPVHNKN
jgi:hypothetical protein